MSDGCSITPLGSRKVSDNSGTMVVTLPKETAEGVGLEPGMRLHVGYDEENDRFVYEWGDDWDGW